MKDNRVRLQKFIASSGVASRRKAEELIEQGRVKVNGHPASLGDKVDPVRDKVMVCGKRVIAQKNKVYIMLHKPRGYVTTMSDERGRKTVNDLVKDLPERVFPVGRLDRDSEGLIFMTNDGDFANTLTHPSRHVNKTYRVTVREKVSEEQIVEMELGIVLDDVKTQPCEVWVI